MSTFPIEIKAPTLSNQYGANVEEVFNNIDQNFKVLANSSLYKGDSGKSLITLSIPWNSIFVDNGEGWIPVIEINGYSINNPAADIESALGELSQGTDVTDIIDQLKNSNSNLICCIEEPNDSSVPSDIKSSIPYVVVDLRFRQNLDDDTINTLTSATDMSCVITFENYDGDDTSSDSEDDESSDEGELLETASLYSVSLSNNSWKCNQCFPTLYFDGTNMYWKINGQNTKISARGPAGKDGSTGVVYIGLADGIESLPSSSSQKTVSKLWNGSEFVDINDYMASSSAEIQNGAPLILLPESSSGTGSHLYVTSISYNDSSASAYVGPDNACDTHITNNYLKTYLQTHVVQLPEPGTASGDYIGGYAIKDSTGSASGYMIYRINNGPLTITHVDDINQPTGSDFGNIKLAANISEGNSTASGGVSHAEGDSSIASGDYSHAEGWGTTASATGSHAEGIGVEANNVGEHAQGMYNQSHTGSTASEQTIHSIGIGASASSRSNAVEVMKDGNVHIKGIGEYDGTNPSSSNSLQTVVSNINTTMSNMSGSIRGLDTVSKDNQIKQKGGNTASNDYEVALGKYNYSMNYSGSSGSYSTASNTLFTYGYGTESGTGPGNYISLTDNGGLYLAKTRGILDWATPNSNSLLRDPQSISSRDGVDPSSVVYTIKNNCTTGSYIPMDDNNYYQNLQTIIAELQYNLAKLAVAFNDHVHENDSSSIASGSKFTFNSIDQWVEDEYEPEE